MNIECAGRLCINHHCIGMGYNLLRFVAERNIKIGLVTLLNVLQDQFFFGKLYIMNYGITGEYTIKPIIELSDLKQGGLHQSICTKKQENAQACNKGCSYRKQMRDQKKKKR